MDRIHFLCPANKVTELITNIGRVSNVIIDNYQSYIEEEGANDIFYGTEVYCSFEIVAKI